MMMTTSTNSICNTIDAISRDSQISDDPRVVAQALSMLYADRASDVLAAIDELAADSTWSQDAEPYHWLADVRDAVADAE